MQQASSRKAWIIKVILILWGLQVIWLFTYFAPEAQDLARRLSRGDVGAAIRREDPLYLWLQSLAALIPEHAAYVFVDNYEAGKEIQARYFLTPRRHILLTPEVPADFLFYIFRREGASFLILRDRHQSLGPGTRAAQAAPAFQPVDLPGPGQVFRVDHGLLKWGFYD
jgi:hypothetical protein